MGNASSAGDRASNPLVSKTGSWWHLAGRFFDYLTATPLSEDERADVDGWLSEPEARLFWAQRIPDQRHGLQSSRSVAREAPKRPDLIRAALLHDVGKQQASLGLAARIVAGTLTKLRVRVGGRMARHVDHSEYGARDLQRTGAEPIVVEFARHHHGQRPEAISEEDWRIVSRADRSWFATRRGVKA